MWTKILLIAVFTAFFWAGNNYLAPYFKAVKEHRDYRAYQTTTMLDGIDVKPGQHEQALPIK